MTDARHSPAADFLASNGDDMFANVPLENDSATTAQASAQAGDMLTFQGLLTRNAELRSTTANDGLHSIPIVVLELQPIDKAGKQDLRTCKAEIPFTDSTRSAAEACARAHKKGMVVTVASHPLQTRLVLPAAQIINSYTPS